MGPEDEQRRDAGRVAGFLARVDARWPSAKYASWGFYSAWVLLVMNGFGVESLPFAIGQAGAGVLLYVYSGIALTCTYVLCGACARRVQAAIADGPLVPVMALVASACTLPILVGAVPTHALFALLACGTGVGTGVLGLRIGCMFSELDSDNVMFSTFGAGLLAHMLFFLCTALSQGISRIVVSALPLCAMLCAQLKQPHPREHDDVRRVPAGMLPQGFLARCVLFVAVFSLAVGFVKGAATLSSDAQVLQEQAATNIFATMLISLAVIVVLTLASGARRRDMSGLYYPFVIVSALACLLAPLLGTGFLWLQTMVMSVAYNVFTLALWCMFSNIAGQTDIGAVRVFGLGRAASAFGTTAGYAAVVLLGSSGALVEAYLPQAGVVSAVLILIVSMLVFDERTVADALEKTYRRAEVTGAPADASGAQTRERTCAALAERAQLTAREREALMLLGRGYSAQAIAESLGISVNTAKGHIKNVYAKCGVHARQELIDMLERLDAES